MALRVRKNKVAPPPACPLTECMRLLRGAWAPNVIWYLSAQARRFGELRVDIPRISARVLSARLRELEDRGVVTRSVVPTSPPSVEYALTDLGRELVPAIAAIVAVGRKLKERDLASPARPRPRRRARGAAPQGGDARKGSATIARAIARPAP
jgi:DNA-binding HxlR family transcriptional regulator